MLQTNIWDKSHSAFGVFERRARGELPIMEVSKFLTKEISKYYQEGETLLDAGCGAGHFFRAFREFMPENLYYGIDYSPHLIEAAIKLFPEASFQQVCLEDFKSKKFDHVVCSNVLPHVEDLRSAFNSLIQLTSKRLYIRMLIDEETYLIKRVLNHQNSPHLSSINPQDELGANNKPIDFYHFNIYSIGYVTSLIESLQIKKYEIFKDNFMDLEEIKKENKGKHASKVIDSNIVIGNIICPWAYIFIDLS